MTLEEVIAKARREWQSAHNEVLAKAGHAPDNRIQPSDDVIANAIRAFLGSPEVAKAVIDAYDGGLVREPADNTPSGMRVRFLPVKAMRAALSSIGGE